jgi:hypothetical protein
LHSAFYDVWLYHCFMAVSAGMRVAVLSLASLGGTPRDRQRAAASKLKWARILKWSVGLERGAETEWVQRAQEGS